ncbi:hypothetical protein QVD17_22071 [Tagetes erecta]|uniref:Uncharacterized protein n=1 Tax=Tagetes erecta TaxID=13708 RepID=A0AAD8KCL2_TARER|nr:hypothetical protein QVD17_22071 [Tagetes erecta]
MVPHGEDSYVVTGWTAFTDVAWSKKATEYVVPAMIHSWHFYLHTTPSLTFITILFLHHLYTLHINM